MSLFRIRFARSLCSIQIPSHPTGAAEQLSGAHVCVRREMSKLMEQGSRVRHVALEPTSLSVYARAQRRMKREVSLERICSVEAVVSERFPVTPLQHGLFTSELQWRSRGGNGVSDRGANGKRSGGSPEYIPYFPASYVNAGSE